jgi:hypothetical protein
MTARPASELLYDSEAALRLVDSAIEEIREPDSRRATADRLRQTQATIREVTSAIEVAAAGIMAGLERSLALVEGTDARPESERRGALRDELLAMIGRLQFQDITTQQLHCASSVLTELEHRLADPARVR